MVRSIDYLILNQLTIKNCTSRRPLNNTPSGGTVNIQFNQRYSWNRAVVYCDDASIASSLQIGDASFVSCYTGSCPGGFSLGTATYCTDYSIGGVVSSGEKSTVVTITLGTSFSIGYVSAAWFANLIIGAHGWWNIINRVSTVVRPDGYLNSSPVATTLPVIYKAVGVQHVHVVQMSDFDSNDVLKCRWSIGTTSNTNSYNECADVCSGIPGANLIESNCTLVFTLSTAGWYVAAALQIEDYYSSSSTSPMSSVPLQFLFYGYSAPGVCSTQPVITGVRPNRGKKLKLYPFPS